MDGGMVPWWLIGCTKTTGLSPAQCTHEWYNKGHHRQQTSQLAKATQVRQQAKPRKGSPKHTRTLPGPGQDPKPIKGGRRPKPYPGTPTETWLA